MDLPRLEDLFLLRAGVGILRSAVDSRLLSPALFLMQFAPKVDHLRLQKRLGGLGEQVVYHLHLRPVLVCVTWICRFLL